MRRGTVLGCGLGALLVAASALARPSLQADLNPSTVAPGDQAVYSLTITDAGGGHPSAPDFGGLAVQGPSTSMQSSITISNGQQSIESSTVYTWTVRAPSAGIYLIGPATLALNGQTLRSNAVKLRCDPNAPRAAPPASNNPFGGAFDPFSAFNNFPDPFQRQERPGGDDVFLRATVDKSTVYLGQQVTMSLYLFAQSDVSGVQSVSCPRLDGFWAEDIAAPTQLSAQIREVHGVPYRVYLLRRRALFPLRSGDLTIDPVNAQINVGISIFSGAPSETVKRYSEALPIQVKALPAAGQPPGFVATNVGNLSLAAQLAPATVALGEPVQLKVTLQGTGNVTAVEVPKPLLPPGLKTYDPTVRSKSRVSGWRYGGVKTVEWVIVPERTGTFTVPALQLPYFNPSAGTYEVARTPALPLTVTAPAPGSAVPAPPGTVAAPLAANVLTDTVRPIRIDADLAAADEVPVWAKTWFWPVTGAPMALWGLLWAGSALGLMLRRRDPEKLKVKRARGQASRRLKVARELARSDDARGFHAELERALQQFVTDKIGVPALGLTGEQLHRHLTEKGVPEKERAQLVDLLARSETARFAPQAATGEELERALGQAARVIDAIDGLRLPRSAG